MTSLSPASVQMPRILDGSDPGAIVEAGRLLRGGSVVVLPTDTGYGIAAGVFHPESVERVFAIKRREATVSLPVFIATAADLPLVARDVPAAGWKLIGKFWPGPLSLVLPVAKSVPRSVTGGRGTVAVRVPNSRVCLQVLEFLGEAVTGTSANISGRPGALSAADALEQLGTAVDAILVDDSAIVEPRASTVVEFKDGAMIIHREGPLSSDALRGAAVAGTMSHSQLLTGRNRR
jgi:L-threonylcarbamoyladenylate synthase